MKRGLDALGRVSCGALGEVLLGRREGGERRERSECSEGRSRQGGRGGRGQGKGREWAGDGEEGGDETVEGARGAP